MFSKASSWNQSWEGNQWAMKRHLNSIQKYICSLVTVYMACKAVGMIILQLPPNCFSPNEGWASARSQCWQYLLGLSSRFRSRSPWEKWCCPWETNLTNLPEFLSCSADQPLFPFLSWDTIQVCLQHTSTAASSVHTMRKYPKNTQFSRNSFIFSSHTFRKPIASSEIFSLKC